MQDVIIEIRGGVVQSVAVRGDDVRVAIIDWDDLECAPVAKFEAEWIQLGSVESLTPDARRIYERLIGS